MAQNETHEMSDIMVGEDRVDPAYYDAGIGWQPIETTPPQGTVGTLYFPQDADNDFAGLDYRYRLAIYKDVPLIGPHWCDQGTNHDSFEGPDASGDWKAVAWMPLPPPPGE